jgi:hypothetical protein
MDEEGDFPSELSPSKIIVAVRTMSFGYHYTMIKK